jgi:hypothetical protein
MRHLFFESIASDDVAIAVQLIIGKSCRKSTGSIEHPAAKICGRRPTCPHVFVRQSLELFIRIFRKIRPVNLEAENSERENDKDELPKSNASIGDRLCEAPLYFLRQVLFVKKFWTVKVVVESQDEETDEHSDADDVNDTQPGGSTLQHLAAEDRFGAKLVPVELE